MKYFLTSLLSNIYTLIHCRLMILIYQDLIIRMTMQRIKPLVVLILPFLIGCSVGNEERFEYDVSSIPDVEEVIIEFNENEGEASNTKNFYFIFDASGSMNQDCAGQRKINGAKTAINKFIDKVPDDINVGLLVFGLKNEKPVKELVILGTGQKAEFKEAINGIVPNGSTPLGEATDIGMTRLVEQYKRQLGYGEYRLIIVTDGIASSAKRFKSALQNSMKYPFVSLYGIGLCIQGDHMLKTYALSYTDADNYEELEEALTETISELSDFDPNTFDFSDFEVSDEQ